MTVIFITSILIKHHVFDVVSFTKLSTHTYECVDDRGLVTRIVDAIDIKCESFCLCHHR